MQLPQLTFENIALLLALAAIALLITLELLSSRYKQVNIILDRRRLRIISMVIAVLFLITFLIVVVNLILGS
ncbi:MAG: hypothetical protein NWF01_03975 [Candidatus Bathyarchaeota archaeon]|nr:hypothetical protein [Candidatus Bathyarchaeota archaeon]